MQEIAQGMATIVKADKKTKTPAKIDIYTHNFGELLTQKTLEEFIPNSFSQEEAQKISNTWKRLFAFGPLTKI